MTLTIELAPELEAQLREAARQRELDAVEYVRQLLERELPSPMLTARQLLALPPEQRAAHLAAAAQDAAPLYTQDLDLPEAQRELTALTALDGQTFGIKQA